MRSGDNFHKKPGLLFSTRSQSCLRKQINFTWQECVQCKRTSLCWRYGYTSCLFCKWPSQNYKQDLRKLDVKFRKLVRTMVGPPGGLDWSAPWHHILHEWNARVLECAGPAGVKLWSRRCLEQHWKLPNYIANVSDNRWLKRALAWTAGRRTRIGRPTNTWDAQIQMYCRWQNLGEWRATAMQTNFLADTYGTLYWIVDAEVVRVEISLGFVVSLRPKGAAFGQAGSTRLY